MILYIATQISIRADGSANADILAVTTNYERASVAYDHRAVVIERANKTAEVMQANDETTVIRINRTGTTHVLQFTRYKAKATLGIE